MEQRDDQLLRADASPLDRMWGEIYKVTLGYGYQPVRTLPALALVVVVSFVLAIVPGSHGAFGANRQSADPGRPCPIAQQLSVSLGIGLPIGISSSVAREYCDLPKKQGATAVMLIDFQGVLRILT